MDLRYSSGGMQQIVGNMGWMVVIDRRVGTIDVDKLARGKIKRQRNIKRNRGSETQPHYNAYVQELRMKS